MNIAPSQAWDVPFARNMTDADVDRLLSIPPFSRLDAEAFSPSNPLRSVLLNDTRLRTYQNGDLIVREGDYGNSAFFIVSGTVQIILDSLPDSVLGRAERKSKGFFGGLAQLWSNAKEPEARKILHDDVAEGHDAEDIGIGTRSGSGRDTQIYLQDVQEILRTHSSLAKEGGEFFGEIAALGRTPRTATVISYGEAELLEIRWQGLREFLRRSTELKDHIETIYRERSLKAHLQGTPIFQHLDQDDLTEVADQTVFKTFGNFEWYAAFLAGSGESTDMMLHREPLIAEEGHYPNGLIMIRSGQARMSRRFDHGHRTVSYPGHGFAYGLPEIVHNWRNKSTIPLQHSLRALGYVDVLIIPTRTFEKFVLGPDPQHPLVPQRLLPPPIVLEQDEPSVRREDTAARIGEEQVELLGEYRFMNGTATMMIDLDRCTRCDDCVSACSATHDNNPRFKRHGPKIGHFMVANACMHCADPVCMIGCPTGAIHRDPFGGEVLISDATCIGCGICANSCPYQNINLVQIRDEGGALLIDEATHSPIMKATKCDLCADQMGGPACQRACPHDALRRVDLHSDLESLADWITR